MSCSSAYWRIGASRRSRPPSPTTSTSDLSTSWATSVNASSPGGCEAVAAADDRGGRVDVEVAGEHRQSPQGDALRLAPGGHGSSRSSPASCGAGRTPCPSHRARAAAGSRRAAPRSRRRRASGRGRPPARWRAGCRRATGRPARPRARQRRRAATPDVPLRRDRRTTSPHPSPSARRRRTPARGIGEHGVDDLAGHVQHLAARHEEAEAGQRSTRRRATAATPATTCSALSSTSSTRCSPMCWARRSTGSSSAVAATPRAASTACARPHHCRSGASSTSHTPSGWRSRAAVATSMARRCLADAADAGRA